MQVATSSPSYASRQEDYRASLPSSVVTPSYADDIFIYFSPLIIFYAVIYAATTLAPTLISFTFTNICDAERHLLIRLLRC